MLWATILIAPSTSLAGVETVLDLDFGLPAMIPGWIGFVRGVVVRNSVHRFKNEFRVGTLSLYTGWYIIGVYRSSGSETLLSFGVFGSYEFVDLCFGFPQVNN